MATPRIDRRLAAILAADVAGYSRLMGEDEAGTLERLKAHRKELIEPLLVEHHGRIVKLMGDGALYEFGSVVDAVACGVAIQRGMAEREKGVPAGKNVRFRIGINLGDVIVEGDDIHGDGVNVAARLEALAEPGGICVSRTVRDHVRDKLPCAFEDLGEHQIKNIARTVRVFRVLTDAGAIGRRAVGQRKSTLELVGTYACYSHAWSPYFRGRLIRGILSIAAAPGPQRLLGTYTEALPTGRMRVEGTVTMAERALYLDLCEPQGGARFLFCLSPPTAPASVLGGFMSGAAVIGPESQPSVTRIVMVRLPTASPPLDPPDAYLPPDASLAGDIVALGLAVADPDLVDRALAAFLSGGGGGGLDQIPWAAWRAVVEVFDRQWLGRAPPP
jgi:class 3 adenylate cyclase